MLVPGRNDLSEVSTQNAQHANRAAGNTNEKVDTKKRNWGGCAEADDFIRMLYFAQLMETRPLKVVAMLQHLQRVHSYNQGFPMNR